MTKLVRGGKVRAGTAFVGALLRPEGRGEALGRGLLGSAGQQARQVAARYGYTLSKRTQLYAIATRISNDANAFETFGNAPITSTMLFRDPARGADPTGFGVGMIHTF